MAEATANNQGNVSGGKGVKGGYIFSAPQGTQLPVTVVKSKDELDPAFKVLGFISEDGYVETVDEDSDDLVDMNGDLMDSTNSNRVESAQFTLAEIKAETLRRQYGKDNVTDEGGVITVRHNSDSHSVFSYVLLLKLKNGRNWTKCIPNGQSSELDDLTIASSELCQRALTMKYLTDDAGNTCYDYIESTETSGAPDAVQSVTLDKTTATVAAGADVTLTATVEPDTAADKAVTAESGDTDKATVAVEGAAVTVHGVAATAANKPVTVTVKAGGKTATCAVTVTAPATK